MILSKQIGERTCQVNLKLHSRKQFNEEFKAIIKSLLMEGQVGPVDIFNNLFVAFVSSGKGEAFVNISKAMSEIDLNELKEYLKNNGDE